MERHEHRRPRCLAYDQEVAAGGDDRTTVGAAGQRPNYHRRLLLGQVDHYSNEGGLLGGHRPQRALPHPVSDRLIGRDLGRHPGEGSNEIVVGRGHGPRLRVVRGEGTVRVMNENASCLFCRIVAGEIPAAIVDESDTALAFRDLNPAMPSHVLVVPRRHVANAHEVSPEHADDLVGMFMLARAVATIEGLAERGYRLVLNVGSDSGNTVPHLHLHVLGGRAMAWPPG